MPYDIMTLLLNKHGIVWLCLNLCFLCGYVAVSGAESVGQASPLSDGKEPLAQARSDQALPPSNGPAPPTSNDHQARQSPDRTMSSSEKAPQSPEKVSPPSDKAPPLTHDQIVATHGQMPPAPGREPPPPPPPSAGRGPPPPQRPRLPLFLAPSSELNDVFDGAEAAFVYVLPSRDRQCFHHRSAKPFQFEFRVLHGGRLDVDAYVVGPDGRVAYESRERRRGRFAVAASPPPPPPPPGAPVSLPLYTICLDNRQSSWYAKVVDFSIQLPRRRRGEGAGDDTDAAAVAAAATGPLPEELTAELDRLELNLAQFMELTDAVEDNLHHSASLQREFRGDETLDRMAMEDSANCVTRWSLMQLSVMIVVSALQVLMIRSLFDEKSIFHRVWKSRSNFMMRS